MKDEWYHINDIDEIDSPALAVYRERVLTNISTLISMIDDVKTVTATCKNTQDKRNCRVADGCRCK